MKLKMPSRLLAPLLLGLLLVLILLTEYPTDAYSVNGKRVLVTGSSGGIGRGIAIKLAEEGAEVFVHYNVREDGARETRRLIEDRGGICAGISQCDFSHPAHIHTLFQQINGVWREGMDILVNNAGVISKLAIEDDDDYVTQWRDTMNINLNAPRLLSQLALKGMKKRGGGVIINVSSIHGDKSNEYMSSYAVSKAGLDALTRCMAIEFAEHKVRVNCIAPGVVKVERTEEYFRDPVNVNPWMDRLLLNELGSVDQIADATLPLITNDWITGTIWSIDGGMSARSNMPLRSRPSAYTPAMLPDRKQSPPGGARTLSDGGDGLRDQQAPAPYGGERLGDKPMPGQGGSSFPDQGYNAGRLADQPMSEEPRFGEKLPPPGRPGEQQQPGYDRPPPGGRGDPNDPRFMPEQQGRRGGPGPGQPGPEQGRRGGPGPGQRDGPGPGQPGYRGDYDPRREDPRRRGPPPQQPYEDFGGARGPNRNNMSMPGQQQQQDGYNTGGVPGQGYIPRPGGGPPPSAQDPDFPNRRGGNPPPRPDDYRPLDDPNNEGRPPRNYPDNPRGPRTSL